MSGEISAAKQRMRRRKQYRTWMDRAILLGVLAFFIAVGVWMVADVDVVLYVGLALYYGGFLAHVGIRQYSSMPLIDEREWEIEAKASALTLGVVAVLGIITIPGWTVLDATGVLTMPTLVGGMASGFVLLFVIFAVAYIYVSRTHR